MANYLRKPWFSLTWQLKPTIFQWRGFQESLGRYARLSPAWWLYRGNAVFDCRQVCLVWDFIGDVTAGIDSEHLVPIDLSYVCNNVPPLWFGVKRMLLLRLLSVARMVMWTTRIEGILWHEPYSNQDQDGSFGHKLRMINWISADFSVRWEKVGSLIRVNRVRLDVLF